MATLTEHLDSLCEQNALTSITLTRVQNGPVGAFWSIHLHAADGAQHSVSETGYDPLDRTMEAALRRLHLSRAAAIDARGTDQAVAA